MMLYKDMVRSPEDNTDTLILLLESCKETQHHLHSKAAYITGNESQLI